MTTSKTGMVCPQCGRHNTAAAQFCGACGTRLSPPESAADTNTAAEADPAAAEQPAGPVAVAAGPRWRRHLTRGRVIALAAIVAVLSAGGYMWLGQTVIYPPDGPVKEYFAALERNDIAVVAQMSGLTPEFVTGVMGDDYQPPTSVQIGESSYGPAGDDPTGRPNRNTAHVQVTYQLAGQTVTSSMRLHREQDGATRPWVLDDGETGQLLVVSKYATKAQVGSKTFPTVKQAPPGMEGSIRLPIGTYRLGVPGGDGLFTADQVSVAVPGAFSTPTVTTLRLQVSPKVQPQIERQVKALLDQCAQQTNVELYDCPFGSGKIVVSPHNVKWKITKYPVIALRIPERDIDGPLDMHTTAAGNAVVTYTTYDGSTATVEVDIRVSGRVDLDKETGEAGLATFGKG